MTRRPLGTGPQDLTRVSATEADLHTALPGIRLPDVTDLRARGVLDAHPHPAEDDDQDDAHPGPRRHLSPPPAPAP
ncbi:hypothetical protein ACF1DV_37610 [Streptomyces achromogenes]|uniref:hypothetical protein n=1 Tax=Streptomyces achromogenes TaxID=67255 RepID=UPI0036F930BE